MLEEFINNLSELCSDLRHVSCKSRKLKESTNELNAYGEISLYIDKVFEDIVIKYLSNSRIVKCIYSEESGIIELRDEGYSVVIDPLDGTHNFKMGLPYYAVTIAVIDNCKEVVASYVANLITGSYFSAIKGKGAMCNGVKFFIKPQPEILNIDAIYVGLSRSPIELACLSNVSQCIRSFRAMGCASLDLCCLALGNCGLFIDLSYTAKIVDVLASSLIAEEAGAIVTDFQGIQITDIISRSHNLSEAIFKSKFRVLGAANKNIYEFAYNKCASIEANHQNLKKRGVYYSGELA